MDSDQRAWERDSALRLGPQGGFYRVPDSRWARSWFWMKRVWDLFRGDRSLIAIAALATVLNLLAAALVFGLIAGVVETGGHYSRLDFALGAALFSYPSTVVSTYCNVALIRMAQARFNGTRCSLGDGFRAANERIGAILGWSLVAVVVGFLLRLVAERVPFGGTVLSWLGGIAWSLATMFAVPVLAIEGAGGIEAPKRSIEIFRARYGEGLIGTIGVSAITAVAVIPGILLLAIGVVAGGVGGVLLAIVGAALLALALTAGRAMDQLYALAIYREQVAGEPSFGLDAGQLNSFMRTKRRKGFGGR